MNDDADTSSSGPFPVVAVAAAGAAVALAIGAYAWSHTGAESNDDRARRLVRETLARSPRGAFNATTVVQPYPVVLYRNVLRTPEGDIHVRRLGHGTFADVYREVGGRGRVFALTDDDVHDKEIAAMVTGYGSDDANPHVPAVEKFGHTRDKTVYVMPYYDSPLRKSKSPTAWNDYIALKECRDRAKKAVSGTNQGEDRGYDENQRVVDCVRERAVQGHASPSVAEALDDLVQMAGSYDADEYFLEFYPRNLATDDAGRLVLLDVLFHRKQLLKKRREEERARERR